MSFLLGACFIVIVIGKVVIVAQAPITGEWTADARSENQARENKIQLNFERRTDRGHNNFGQSFSYSDLQGLSRDQTASGKVSFRLVREAGTIDCIGVFANGKGSGTFTFTPNQAFVNGMASRGYKLTEEKMFSAATIDVTLAFVDDLKNSGFGELSYDDVVKAKIFNITPQYMAEMKATGFPNLGMEELVKSRIFNIDSNFVREVKDMGFAGKGDLEELVKFRIFDINPQFLADLKNNGFGNIDPEEAVKFRIFKITPEFLADLKNEGFTNIDPEQAVKFRIFNIDKDFIRKAKAEDPNVTVDKLVEMKIGIRRR